MAKKFGKVLLFTAAVSAAAGAALYFLKKKDAPLAPAETEDEDYDDFWEEDDLHIPDAEEEEECPAEASRETDTVASSEATVETDTMAPAESASETETVAPAEVEEFFHDEGDASYTKDAEKLKEAEVVFQEENSLNEVFLEDTTEEDQ